MEEKKDIAFPGFMKPEEPQDVVLPGSRIKPETPDKNFEGASLSKDMLEDMERFFKEQAEKKELQMKLVEKKDVLENGEVVGSFERWRYSSVNSWFRENPGVPGQDISPSQPRVYDYLYLEKTFDTDGKLTDVAVKAPTEELRQ